MRHSLQFLLLPFLFAFASSQECNVAGECQDGQTVGVALTSSNDLCLKYCQHNTDCELYTYYAESGTCVMFRDCNYFNPDPCYDDCISGEVSMIQSYLEIKIPLVDLATVKVFINVN